NPNYQTDNPQTSSIDPLIVDLTSRGVALSPQWEGVRFDIKANGHKLKISWSVHPQTSIIIALAPVLGAIEQSGHSLFGDRTVGPDGVAAREGFAALAKWDAPLYGGNGDGVISPADKIWPRLRGWRNLARDGVMHPEEMLTMEQLGIKKIDVV